MNTYSFLYDREDIDQQDILIDIWYTIPQIVIMKHHVEFGVNKNFNHFDKSREYDKEIRYMKKLISVQKDIIYQIKKDIQTNNNDKKVYYLIDAGWVKKWRAVGWNL